MNQILTTEKVAKELVKEAKILNLSNNCKRKEIK